MRLCVVESHPIQYRAPLYRMLNAEKSIEVTVLYLSDHSIRGGRDPGFDVDVKWDVPLLEGYESKFLQNEGGGSDVGGFRSYRCSGIGRQFDAIEPDVILVPGHGFQIYWQAVFAAHSRKIPVIIRPESLDGAQPTRSWWKTLVRRISLRQFYRRVSAFCATGHFSRLDALMFGFSEEKIFFAPYCIDTGLFKIGLENMRSQRSEIRSDLGMQEEDIGIVFMGKFIDWKNPKLILDALALLPDRIRERCFPIFVGSGPDLLVVQQRCENEFGSKRYCCPGFVNQSELTRYYVAGDIFVLPSKRGHESWGLVVNEAMTCKLPVIVSDGVGCRVDLVRPGENGYHFQDGHPEELAEGLHDLSENTNTRNTMGERSEEIIQDYGLQQAFEGIRTAIDVVIR